MKERTKERKKEKFLIFSTYKTFPVATGLIADFLIASQDSEEN